MRREILAAATTATLFLGTASAHAAANLVVNGDFEQTSGGGVSDEVNAPNSTSSGTNLTGWTNTGYAYVFAPGTADTTGAPNREFGGPFNLWGPHNGSSNGLTATSPTGGNFFASDGAFQTGTLSQTIGGLTVGNTYILTYWWAAAQQNQNTGATTENWTASFGAQSVTTTTVNNLSQGFVPWRLETDVFVATSTSQVLSFLAAGTPSGTPPMSLLDGVALVNAPEPAGYGVLLVGLLALGAGRLARRSVIPTS